VVLAVNAAAEATAGMKMTAAVQSTAAAVAARSRIFLV
jgi:hypothetical protein